MAVLRLGTRGSKLALVQSDWVREQLLAGSPGAMVETRIIRTSADRDPLTPLRSSEGRGVFVKEIEEALIAGEVDLAVHSMKDVPTTMPDSLEIRAIPAREDARDALLCRSGETAVEMLPAGAAVGTGSVRRQAQLLALRPDLALRDIRGNVDTRLKKLHEGEYDAIVLACAGLRRLNLDHLIGARLEFDTMLPAPGQGALAIQIRRGDRRTAELVAPLHHPPTASAVLAERAFLHSLGGGCNSPIAVYAVQNDGILRITGLVGTPDGREMLRESAECPVAEAEKTAAALAEKMLSLGGSGILSAHRQP